MLNSRLQKADSFERDRQTYRQTDTETKRDRDTFTLKPSLLNSLQKVDSFETDRQTQAVTKRD